MKREALVAKFQLELSNWKWWALWLLSAATVVLFFIGLPELPQLIFGRPPSSIYGLLSIVGIVAIAGKVADKMTSDVASLRLSGYGETPSHWPSVSTSAAIGLLVFVMSWESVFGSQSFTDSASAGLVVGLLAYLTLGRIWRASWLVDWTLKNANSHRFTSYVVEGRTSAGSSWELVSRVDDASDLGGKRQEAHAKFSEVRYWRVESYVTLLQSKASLDMMISEPVNASDVPEREARRKTIAQP